MPRLRTAILFLTASAASAAIAAEEQPGLILTFDETDARPARQVALFVLKAEPASAFTAPGQIHAVLQGNLNLEARSRLVFTLEGTGEAKLTVDDEILCDKLGAPSEEKRLSSGAHPIRIEYTGPADAESQLRLFWEGRDFVKEPVPVSVFTHDPDSSPLLAKQTQLRDGYRLLEEHHCTACHGGAKPGGTPSLEGIGSRLDSGWLARWIADPKSHRPSARMPKLFTDKDALAKAKDIAVFLAPPGKSPPGPALPLTDEAVETGGHLFYDQGCIGCHTLKKQEEGRVSLLNIGHKYRPFALAAFLRDPNKYHPDTRMPQFGFDEAESNALEAFLRKQSDPLQLSSGPTPNPERGETLFKQVGCINCHDTGDGLKSELPPTKPLSELTSPSCKAADYAFTESEQNAIAAALTSGEKPTRPDVEFAQHQFTALRCNACHQRDGQPPFREQFDAEVAHLKPPEPPADEEKPGAHKAEIPHLNYLGFKLNPAAREDLLKGIVDPKTRPWLKARMPAFPSRATKLATGFSHAAGLPNTPPKFPAPDPAEIKTGSELTGITGFSCGACHAIGSKPAFAVFEGEGPNFQQSGTRLRQEYFQLWMHDPQRLWPGTIMPKYATDGLTPLTQHYEGDATKQFDAIFDYLRSLK